jgi:hypothetical protein
MAACDAFGRPVANLIATDNGGALAIEQRDGTRVASIGNGARGGVLRLSDSAGALALSAGADAGGGSMTAYSSDKKPLFTFGPASVGGGELSLRNRAGLPIVVATSASEGGGGQLVTLNAKGDPVVVAQGGDEGGAFGLLLGGKRLLFMESNAGGGRIELGDAQGVSAAALGIDPTSKTGVLSVRGDKGQEAARLGSDDKGVGTLTVYNKTGTERKSFPAK